MGEGGRGGHDLASKQWGGGAVVDAHLILSLAASGAEASNRGAFLTPGLALRLRLILCEALRGLLLQVVGQVMEDACRVLHRLEERKGEDIKYTVDPLITIYIFTNSTLKVFLTCFCPL